MKSVSKQISFDTLKLGDHGIYFGFGLACEVKNPDSGKLEKYYDRQGDHVPEDVMVSAAKRFMAGKRTAKIMHQGDPVGDVRFAMPVTRETAKAMTGITEEVEKTGLYIGVTPYPEYREQFDRDISNGHGWSLGGRATYASKSDVVEKNKNMELFGRNELRDMDWLELDEFSDVDVPAMAPALMDVSKNADGVVEISCQGRNFGELSKDSIKGVLEYLSEIKKESDEGSVKDKNNLNSQHNVMEVDNMSTKNKVDADNKVEDEAVKGYTVDAIVKSFSDEQKAFYDAADESTQKEFLEKDFNARNQMLDSVKNDRKVVYKSDDGTEYFDDASDNEIRLAKQADAMKRQMDEMSDTMKTTAIMERIEKSYSNINGTIKQKVDLITALDSIKDEESRKVAYKNLAKANDSFADLKKSFGSDDAGDELADVDTHQDANFTINKMANDLAQKENISISEARIKIAKSNPALAKKSLNKV